MCDDIFGILSVFQALARQGEHPSVKKIGSSAQRIFPLGKVQHAPDPVRASTTEPIAVASSTIGSL